MKQLNQYRRRRWVSGENEKQRIGAINRQVNRQYCVQTATPNVACDRVDCDWSSTSRLLRSVGRFVLHLKLAVALRSHQATVTYDFDADDRGHIGFQQTCAADVDNGDIASFCADEVGRSARV